MKKFFVAWILLAALAFEGTAQATHIWAFTGGGVEYYLDTETIVVPEFDTVFVQVVVVDPRKKISVGRLDYWFSPSGVPIPNGHGFYMEYLRTSWKVLANGVEIPTSEKGFIEDSDYMGVMSNAICLKLYEYSRQHPVKWRTEFKYGREFWRRWREKHDRGLQYKKSH